MSLRSAILFALLVLVGCETVGPNAVRVGRAKYNDAIQETDKQQTLQNLVRLRYSDFPYFLEVSSILSAPAFEASLDAAANFGTIDAYQIGGGLRYAETPVIVYAPLGGENFTRRLLKPLDFETIAMLSNAGWDSERLYRMCVQSINGVMNAESAAGPTPDTAPDYETFNRIIDVWDELGDAGEEMTGRLEVDRNEDGVIQDSEIDVSVRIDPAVKERPEVARMLRDLNLDPAVEHYRVTSGLRGGGDTISIVTRPLMGVMYYMAQSVEVPSDDVRNDVVIVTVGDDGQPLDRQKVNRA